MQFDFEYTVDDLREVHHLGRKHRPSGRRAKGNRAVLGWALFIALAMLLVFLLNLKSGPAVAPAANSQSSWFAAVFPWAMLAGGAFVIFRALRPSDAAFKKSPMYGKQVSVQVDDGGVSSTDGAAHTRWQWHAFDIYVESERSFSLRLTNSLNWLMLPKRAIKVSTEVEQVRHLFQTHVQSSTGGFPVLPIPSPQSAEPNE